MARKIKFALEMPDGTKVRGGIEELREHFDLETVTGYFLSGKLIEWLEDRYYEDEVEALEDLDKEAPDFRQQLCTILGVEHEEETDMDVEALERLNEKKSILRQKTGDEEIIRNAGITALTQEDLADLLDMDEPVIYLCGESFNVPLRKTGKKYIGILGTPTVNIKAKSQEEVEAKNIVFENVKMPWENTKKIADSVPVSEISPNIPYSNWPVPFEKIHKTVMTVFANEFAKMKAREDPARCFTTVGAITYYNHDKECVWTVVGKKKGIELDETQKEIALTLVCDGEYDIDDIVYIRVEEDLTAGWALTKDSFCASHEEGSVIIPYKQIKFNKEEEEIDGLDGYVWYLSNSASGEKWDFLRETEAAGYDGSCFEPLRYMDTAETLMKCLNTLRSLFKKNRTNA